MFIIKDTIKNIYFMKEHKKVIVFDNDRDAYNFIEAFFNFAMMETMSTNPFEVINIMQEKQFITVEELPQDFKSETINFSELKK